VQQPVLREQSCMEPSDWNFSFLGETVVGFWQQLVVVVVMREMMMMQQQHWFDALEQTN
jgi:hypothetical protein